MKATENLNLITPNVILENPQRLLILRLAARLSQEEFCHILKIKDFRHHRRFEQGTFRKMKIKTAEQIIKKLKSQIRPVSENELDTLFKIFLQDSNNTKEGLELEDIIGDELEERGIEFERRKNLKGTVFHKPDFIIPNAKNPKIILEVKLTRGRSSISRAKELAFVAVDLKVQFKNALFIVFVKGRWSKNSLRILRKWTDFVIKDDIDRLMEIIEQKL